LLAPSVADDIELGLHIRDKVLLLLLEHEPLVLDGLQPGGLGSALDLKFLVVLVQLLGGRSRSLQGLRVGALRADVLEHWLLLRFRIRH